MEARQKMEKAVKEIQAKADQIYNKFKSNFAFQVKSVSDYSNDTV